MTRIMPDDRDSVVPYYYRNRIYSSLPDSVHAPSCTVHEALIYALRLYFYRIPVKSLRTVFRPCFYVIRSKTTITRRPNHRHSHSYRCNWQNNRIDNWPAHTRSTEKPRTYQEDTNHHFDRSKHLPESRREVRWRCSILA